MKISDHIERFYENIAKASTDLASFSAEIDDCQYHIRRAVAELITNFESESITGSPNKLEAMCLQTINSYKESIAQWVNTIDKMVAGKEFINKFEKSILLTVFANVNAGKSTLGNFISGYHFKGTPFEHYYRSPRFFAYDWSQNDINNSDEQCLQNGYFRVAATEATATIQYFTLLDGLTWVDTPGIHSLTTENEELAKQYVAFSDLVVFLTPSNDPGKLDEIREMERLMKDAKPMLVVITRSDERTREVDGDDYKPVLRAKTPETRRIQEEFVASRILKTGILKSIEDKRYISISVDVASKALAENDEVLFEASNIPQFYEQIGGLISNKSIELKKRRPKNEVNAVIRQITESSVLSDGDFDGINRLREDITAFMQQVKEQESALDNSRQAIKQSLIGNLKLTVTGKLTEIRNRDGSIDSASVSNVVSDIATVLVNKIVSEKVSKILEDFVQSTPINLRFNIDAQLKDITQTFEYETMDLKTYTRDPEGLLELLGALLLGMEYKETRTVKRTEEKTIKIGDNLNEVIQQTITQLSSQLDKGIDLVIEALKADYFGGVEKALRRLLSGLDALSEKLVSLRYLE